MNISTNIYQNTLTDGFGLLDKASRMLVRTNPKLSTNVKVVTNGNSIWLESYDADKNLADSKYKAFSVSGDSLYNKDVVKFYGTLDAASAYKVMQQYDDLSVKDSYDLQYETFYHCGCEYVKSLDYDEQFGFVAPLWIDEQIPEWFVIFKVDEPSYFNLAENLNGLEELDFKRDILDKCTIVKTFSLKEGSAIGRYIRNYRNQDKFPVSPLFVRMESDGYISFNGISYKTGEFTEAQEHDFDRMFCKDETVIGFDGFVTEGFERNGIICANIMNIEFLFDDTTSDNYTINRYFGLYCNYIEDGVLELDYERLANCGNTYSRPLAGFDRYTRRNTVALNDDGVVLPVLNGGETLFPSYANLNNDGNDTVSCVLDKTGSLHKVCGSCAYGSDALRLTDKRISLTDFNGFVKTNRSVTCQYEDNVTPSQLIITVNSEILPYTRFYLMQDIGTDTCIGSIEANELWGDDNLPMPTPGWFEYDTFSGSGSPSVIASALASSFNAVFDVGLHAYHCENKVIIVACNSSEVYNSYRIECTASDTVSLSNGGVFCGANDFPHVKIRDIYSELLQVGEYIPTRTQKGYGMIVAKTLDLDSAETSGDRLSFNDGLWYDVLLDEGGVFVNRTNTVSLYDSFYPTYGRLSFFPVHDFDFQTTSPMTQYGDYGELDYERVLLGSEVFGGIGTDFSNEDINAVLSSIGINVGGDTLELGFYTDPSINIIPPTPATVDATPTEDEDVFDVQFYLTHYNTAYEESDPTELDLAFDFASLSSDLADGNRVTSEYMRLYENFSKEFMLLSKSAPYINKWVYHDNGFDVRENKYRLNTNPVFGMNSFAPDPYIQNGISTNPSGFGCEWFYIFDEYPNYDGVDLDNFDFAKIWSYAGVMCPANIEQLLLDTYTNYFNVYFVRDHVIDVTDNTNPIYHDTLDYVKKYSLIENGSANTVPETFFRGAKIEFMQKDDYAEVLDNNLNTISVKSDSSMNGYRFVAAVVPVLIDDALTDFKIKVIRNDVFKFVVMLIYVVKEYQDAVLALQDDNNVHVDRIFKAGRITRYLLYNSQKKIFGDGNNNEGCIANNVVYGGERKITVKGRGRVSAINYPALPASPVEITGEDTNFLDDFSDEERIFLYVYKATPTSIYYTPFKVVSIDNDTSMKAVVMPQNPQSTEFIGHWFYENGGLKHYLDTVLHAQYSPQIHTIAHAKQFYMIAGCDASIFTDYYANCNFVNIVNSVNHTQSNDVTYIHIDKGGAVHRTDDAHHPEYTFALRFVMPSDNAKYEYLDYSFDGEHISYFNNPKYAFRMQRYGGWFEPLTNPVIYFKDPFLLSAFKNVADGYQMDALRTARFKNTCFACGYKGFGIVRQMAFHRVNETNSNPFKLNDGEKPIYPVSNRFAVGYKDVNVFNSSWDLWYFVKTNSVTDEQFVHGTCSMLEKNAMLGSKCMTLPDAISIETFAVAELNGDNYKNDSEHTVFYSEKGGSVSYTVMVERRIKEYMHGVLKPYFENYVSEVYSYGDRETIDDDIDRYVEQNILPLYMFDKFDLYVKKTPNGRNREMLYTYIGSSDTEKAMGGLRTDNTFGLSVVDYSEYDKKIVINTKEQYTYEVAFTLHIKKR